MAQTTLPAFPFPGFPQALDAFVGREIARVDRILAQNEVPTCAYESPESSVGACDGGFACTELATADGFCRKHQGVR